MRERWQREEVESLQHQVKSWQTNCTALREENRRLRVECGLRQIAGYAKGKCDQDDKIDELKAALANARAQALEDAALECEARSGIYAQPVTCTEIRSAIAANNACADAIRSRKALTNNDAALIRKDAMTDKEE